MTVADDTAAANAIGSGDEATARSALGKLHRQLHRSGSRDP
jgi:hypothetical protein